jgi:hypothetical protein
VNTSPPSDNAKFDVAVEPAPHRDVVEAEEDEQARRDREVALASTFDPALAHHGKTDEEILEERQDDTRMILDAAIVTGVVIAIAETGTEDVVPPEADDDDGGD